MYCYFCGSDQSSVIDKRSVKSTGEIRRRRECLKCGKRYTTYERISELELFVIKRDGRKEVFSQSKLRSGVEKALEKRPSLEQLDQILANVEAKLWEKGRKEVDSGYIGQVVLEELQKLDQIAYLRFASVYRHFSDAVEFAKELEKISTK